ncbi:hypothetical protein NEOLEDRAFT_1141940 [Neolentinus lepideus HHB14362 ss-1]|uniref:Pheromone n=1 Tax=Neolentinus lepideus HHB14362 ss-1 TaxID=1314782 RepID=A0A165NFV6_9AGAM|nr:hypothetical protein NEOLEDRAFT_1141940 [Neolentinus lepideus HHB14362 ss-1]
MDSYSTLPLSSSTEDTNIPAGSNHDPGPAAPSDSEHEDGLGGIIYSYCVIA